MRRPQHDLVMIGPLPPPIGGASRTFEEYVGALREMGLRVRVVDTSPDRIPSRLRRVYQPIVALRIAFGLVAARHRRAPVVWFQTPPMIFQLHPLLRLAERSGVALYSFAGDLGSGLLSFDADRRRRVVTDLRRARRLFVETQLTAHELREAGLEDVEVLGCFRREPSRAPDHRPRENGPVRIVYVGQLWEGKGIRGLFALSRLAQGDLLIDLYGSPVFGFDQELHDLCANGRWITWHGLLAPDRVPETLAAADFSILLSSQEGEGYPGTVLESLQVGTPVIVSRHRALPELVDDGVSGLVVDSVGDGWDLPGLCSRLRDLTPVEMERLRRGAGEKAATAANPAAPRRLAAAIDLRLSRGGP